MVLQVRPEGKADQDRLNSRARADDRRVDETVRVGMLVLAPYKSRAGAMDPGVVTHLSLPPAMWL
jgi:hypothetical protein